MVPHGRCQPIRFVGCAKRRHLRPQALGHQRVVAPGPVLELGQIQAEDLCRSGVVERRDRPVEAARQDRCDSSVVELGANEGRAVAPCLQQGLQQQSPIPGIAGARHERPVRSTQHARVGIEGEMIPHEGERGPRIGAERCCQLLDIPVGSTEPVLLGTAPSSPPAAAI